MTNFFSNFPSIDYNIDKTGDTINCINLLSRIAPVVNALEKVTTYYNYFVQDREKPFEVSDKFYNTTEYDWIILLFNLHVDPYFSWPLSYNELQAYLTNRYGSVEQSTQTIKFYQKIVQEKQVLFDGTSIPERTINIDQTAYNALSAEERKIVYAYNWEIDRNEDRRQIKIVHERFIPQILEEKERIFL